MLGMGHFSLNGKCVPVELHASSGWRHDDVSMTSSGWCHGDTLGGPRRCRELVLNTRSLARRGCEICAYDPFLRQGSRAGNSIQGVNVNV